MSVRLSSKCVAAIVAAPLCCIAGLIGCQDPSGHGPLGKQLSVVFVGETLQSGFDLGDTVRLVNGHATVTFFTFGSSSCTKAAGEDVVSGLRDVTITPYDQALPPSTICTADLGQFRRTVVVTPTPGSVVFRLRGRGPGAANDSIGLVTLEKTVTVVAQ